jgi:hypothetical protein
MKHLPPRPLPEPAAHTPGPWNVGDMATQIRAGPQRIASTEPSGRRPGGETDIANARLIAAAPELLAALEAIYALFPCHWDRVDGAAVVMPERVPQLDAAFEQARAAIAKARGAA